MRMICVYPSLHPGTEKREHLFQLPVVAFGLRTHPIIHPACICRLEQRTVSLTCSFSRKKKNLRPIITWKSRTHARTCKHAQTVLFLLLLPWQQIPVTRTGFPPHSFEEVFICVCVCVWQCAQLTTNSKWVKVIQMAHNQGTPPPNCRVLLSDNEWHLWSSTSSKRVFG